MFVWWVLDYGCGCCDTVCWVWDLVGLSGFGCFGCLGCLGCQLGFGLVVFWRFCCEFVGDYCLVLYLM